MSKITAGNYFKDSVLFNAELIEGNPSNSGKSSAVRYSLTCKKCGEPQEKSGNAKTLNKCTTCKRVWDRETNSIEEPAEAVVVTPVVEAPVEVKSKRAAAKQELDAADVDVFKHKSTRKDVAEPIKLTVHDTRKTPVEVTVSDARKTPITSRSIANLLSGSSKKSLDKCQPKKTTPISRDVSDDEEYVVSDILDYYDERIDGIWHRFYRVKWAGYDELDFVMDTDFTDEAFLKTFEMSLPMVERFKIMFSKPKNIYANVGHRTKFDVLIDETPAETTSTTPYTSQKEDVVEQLVSIDGKCSDADVKVVERVIKYVSLKKGQCFMIGDYVIRAE